jgi:hypothetical protein
VFFCWLTSTANSFAGWELLTKKITPQGFSGAGRCFALKPPVAGSRATERSL